MCPIPKFLYRAGFAFFTFLFFLNWVTNPTIIFNCNQKAVVFPRTCPSWLQEDYFTASKNQDHIHTSCKLSCANSKVPPILQSAKRAERETAMSLSPLINAVPSNSLWSCARCLESQKELFCSAKPLTRVKAAAVFCSSGSPTSSLLKQKMQIRVKFLEFWTANLISIVVVLQQFLSKSTQLERKKNKKRTEAGAVLLVSW